MRKILGGDAIRTVQGRGYRFELDVETAGLATTPVEHHHLPYSGTAFVGRKEDLKEIARFLSRTRLLTLTGSGGCGKTRLAVEFVRALKGDYPDGIWFVDLASLTAKDTVFRVVATATGCREEAGKSAVESLCSHWVDRQGLIILDNAEHVLDSVAQVVQRLLGACNHLVFIVTSRERLNVAGEQVYRVPAMAVPALAPSQDLEALASNESAELLIRRAQLVRPDFELTAKNCSPLASVCRRLEGIPLSIELAAARLQVMSVEELDDRLRHSLILLTGGARSAQGRQRTLRALISWSFDLLTEFEQDLLMCASVFAGGWDLESAEQVCAATAPAQQRVLEVLASLVDKSLVLTTEGEAGTRYRMLEAVREFATEQLAASDKLASLQQRHLQHFLGVAEQTAPKVLSQVSHVGLNRIASDQENFRAALDYCERQGIVHEHAKLVESLWRYWYLRGHFDEAARALDRVARAGIRALGGPLAAKIYYGLGTIAQVRGQGSTGFRYLKRALKLFKAMGDEEKVASSLAGLGLIAKLNNDLEASRHYQEEALAAFRKTGNRGAQANSLNNLGTLAQAQQDYSKARSLHLEALDIRRALNNRWGVANSIQNLASVAFVMGEYKQAIALAEEGYEIFHNLSDPRGKALARGLQGMALNRDGLWSQAHPTLLESVQIFRQIGDLPGLLEVLFALAYSVGHSDPLRAARIWGAVERKYDELKVSAAPNTIEDNLRQIAEVRKRVTAPAFEAAWGLGRLIGVEEALAMASLP